MKLFCQMRRRSSALVAFPFQPFFVLLLTLIGAVLHPAIVGAQTVPTNCRPNSGASFECAMRFPGPYSFLAGSCANLVQKTEAAAFNVYRQLWSNFQCSISFSPKGWISPSAPKRSGTDFVIACAGTPSDYPVMFYGKEATNWSLETVTADQGAWPTCGNPRTLDYATVRRERSFFCPEGYQTFSQDVCYRVPAVQDYAKNYGCPSEGCTTTKNPINIAVGNKIKSELDYKAGGNSPLTFGRFYNSLPLNNPASGHYKGISASPSTSMAGYSGAAAEPSESSTHYSVVGLGLVGAGWRHTYQRAIVPSSGTLLTSAFAYRQDGRVLTFTKMAGVWYGQRDFRERLEEVVDSGGVQIGWLFTSSADAKETYSLAGRLLSIRSRSGVTETLSYDTCNRLSSVVDSFGNAISFGYVDSCAAAAPAHRIASVTVPGGGAYLYAYDADDRLTSVTYPDGNSRQYHYENSSFRGALTGITDEAGQRYATYGYDSVGRANLSELANGVERVSLTYPGTTIGFSNATLTTALGASINYSFAIEQGVSKLGTQSAYCQDCPANAKQMTYDANGNVATRKDFNNIVTTRTFDLTRNLETSRTEASSTPRARTITTQWHPTYRLQTQVDEPGRRTQFTHDADGNVLTRTIVDLTSTPNISRTWTYTYNWFGQVLTADGPRTDVSDVTAYTYYNCSTGTQCGQLQTVTNAAGHVTTYNTYNAHGQPLTITDPNGVVTTLTYDLRQRLKTRTVGSEVTSFDYWPTGLLRKATLPDGGYLEYTYDAAHRLTDINDAEGNRFHYMLDLMGNRTGEQAYDLSNALTRTRTRVFNTLNQLYQEIAAAGTAAVTTTYGYDSNGNQTTTVAPLGRDTTQAYDELNRVKQVTDPLNGVTQYGYNALDQLISVTDPRNLVTSYSYSGLGDLKQQTSPDTGVTTNTYDSGGNLATSTDARSAVATYTYDALNRVATTAFASGSTTDQALTYTYDAGTYGKGRLTGVSDADHSLSWTYDDQGRVVTAGQVVGSVSKTTSYSYANGLRQSMTTPSGQVITYSYTNGKITGVSVNGTVLVSNILYDPFGPLRQWTWANGSLAVRTFDQDGKIAQIDSAGLKTYSYDDASRITGITDTTNSALSWTYGYDDLDRLTSASKTGTTLGYTYDTNGNRLIQTGAAASTFTIAANSNRLTSTSGALARTYGYDNAGNTTSFTGITFTYNNRGRMKSSTKSGVTTNYIYNALGQLIKKGTSTLYYYDEAGHIIGIYDGSGALTEEIVWLGDTPIVSLRPKVGGGINIYNIHTDHLNTPRVITGSVNPGDRWRWDGQPFGGGTINNNPSGVGVFNFDLRFPGQIAMAETGLNYNYYRDYDPATGRYVQSDPIGLDGGTATYTYVDASPLMLIDPQGLSPFKLIKLCAKGYKVIRNLTKKEAVSIARRGAGDIKASSHSGAREVGRLASGGKKPIRDPIHPDPRTGSTEGRMPHYHPNPRTGSHIFYSIAGGLTAANYASCTDCAEETLLEVVDWFNPLSAPQDVIDIYDEF
ncbi:RHS repeat-associated core domain-containing protein [Steroidobacter flavus]|uniref:RHS repeat-associated core domain-containing protein n=1 Tax=Steroidobacter flavus TaxID=1842136 RepID=A0ABV8SV40_9GAMM